MLDKGQELDWFSSKTIVWCAAISSMAFLGFVVRQLLTPFPIVDLRVLKNRNFAVGQVMIFLSGRFFTARRRSCRCSCRTY
jgi:MFS transporter, DHA2 family, multidrug resistance protein